MVWVKIKYSCEILCGLMRFVPCKHNPGLISQPRHILYLETALSAASGNKQTAVSKLYVVV